jgi:hypothetical protein
MGRPLHLLGLLTLLPATGCYSYQTIRMESVRPDLDVRLHVTAEAAGHVATVLGYLTEDVSGTVVSVARDTLMLSVATPVAPESRTIQVLHQQLDLPVSQVIEVQQRRFSRGKTYACVAGAVAAGAGLAVWGFSGFLGSRGGETTPPPVENQLVPGRLLLPLGHLRLGR